MIDWDAFKSQLQQNPNKMLGSVLAIAACFLVIWLLVVAQADSPGQTVSVDQNGRLDSLRISLNQPFGDSLEVGQQQDFSGNNGQDSSSPFSNALPTFLILMAAIGGLWYWIKKGNTSSRDSSSLPKQKLFTPVGAQQLSNGHQIEVIKINHEYWVMSSSTQQAQLLHRFSEEEWKGPEGADMEEVPQENALFAHILKSTKVKEMAGSNGSSE